MVGLIGMLISALTPLAKSAFTLAKWIVAQTRLLASHAWMLYNWWLKYAQHNIVLKIAVWAAWTAAIEGIFALLSNVAIEPLSGALLRTIIPADGSALLWAFWEEGVCARVALRCCVAYLGLYLALQAALRQAQSLQRMISAKFVNPQVFAK